MTVTIQPPDDPNDDAALDAWLSEAEAVLGGMLDNLTADQPIERPNP